MIPLYQLYDTAAKQRIQEPYFNTLCAARRTRRVYNRDAKNPLRFVVVPGPAHRKFRP